MLISCVNDALTLSGVDSIRLWRGDKYMSDKPKVGDLVWVRPKCSDLEEDWYLTEYPWDDDGLDVTPFKPTEVVQIKRLMDAIQAALLPIYDQPQLSYDVLKTAFDKIKADGRITIEREGK